MAERLLSDLVKITEGFQSLRKQNEELRTSLLKEKQLVGSEGKVDTAVEEGERESGH